MADNKVYHMINDYFERLFLLGPKATRTNPPGFRVRDKDVVKNYILDTGIIQVGGVYRAKVACVFREFAKLTSENIVNHSPVLVYPGEIFLIEELTSNYGMDVAKVLFRGKYYYTDCNPPLISSNHISEWELVC